MRMKKSLIDNKTTLNLWPNRYIIKIIESGKYKMIKKKKYDIVYSLGSNCACALYLNKHNLRTTSGPFDWVAQMSFENRIHLILNNFTGYLDMSDLKKVTPDNPKEVLKHEIYKHETLGCVFPHDFALNVPLKQSHREVLKKYRRRIDRFYDNIHRNQKILFVWFSLDGCVTDEEILWASNTLRKKFNKDIDIVVIEHDEELFNKKMCEKQPNSHSTKITLFARKLNDTADFTKGNTKLCGSIFKRYALNKALIENIKVIVVKTICKLIPIKRYRKQIRSVLLYGKI